MSEAQGAGAAQGGSQRKHTVQSGETLTTIAKQYYNDSSQYMAIFNANKDKLSNPDNIQAGIELVIPDNAGSAGRS